MEATRKEGGQRKFSGFGEKPPRNLDVNDFKDKIESSKSKRGRGQKPCQSLAVRNCTVTKISRS